MQRSADNDFDAEVRRLWSHHLATLSPTVALTKRWKSGYWRNWFADLNLLESLDDVDGGDLLVAETEEDVDEGINFEQCSKITVTEDADEMFNWITEVEVSDPVFSACMTRSGGREIPEGQVRTHGGKRVSSRIMV